MAASDVRLTIRLDDKLGKMIVEMAEEVKRQRDVSAVLGERLDHVQDRLDRFGARLRHVEQQPMDTSAEELRGLHEAVREFRDGLDAWAGRIQRLEALPGVAEALKAHAEQ